MLNVSGKLLGLPGHVNPGYLRMLLLVHGGRKVDLKLFIHFGLILNSSLVKSVELTDIC